MAQFYWSSIFLQIHEVDYEILGDGIYPAVSLQTVGDQVKLKNFYAETNQLWDLLEKQKSEKIMVCILNVTLKAPITTAEDGILIFFFFF